MKKFSLVTAILLLSSAWMLAQSSTSPTDSSQYPSSSPSAQQPAQQPAQSPDMSQSTQAGKAAEAGGTTVEGCIGGSAGNYTLTDSSGKAYQLAGDTSKLGDHVGHDVKVTGTVASAAAGAAAAAGGATPTLTVKKVKMVSSTCPSK
jgi:Protein of unknown function (DUF5818)